MPRFKGNKVSIGMVLLILVTVALCCYSLWNNHGKSEASQSTASMSTRMQQRGMPQNGQGDNKGQVPQRASKSQDSMGEMSPQDSNKGSSAQIQNTRPRGGQFAESDQTGTSNEFFLSIYTVLFFIVFVVSYYLLESKKKSAHLDHHKLMIWTLLAMGLFLRIAVTPWAGGHSSDLSLFRNWATSAAQNLSDFYVNGASDYPPFYIYILFIIGKLATLPGLDSYFTLLLKLPSILADVITGYLIFKLAIRYLSSHFSLLLAAFYIFNPGVFMNSTFWGQVDSFFTLIIVVALMLLQNHKVNLSALLFTVAILMKPQGIIFLPVLFFELVRLKQVKPFITTVVTAILTLIVIAVPFSIHKEPLWLLKLYTSTIGEYPYASVNAFNFFSLIGANYKESTSTLFIFSYHTWGLICTCIITLFSWFIYSRGRNAKFAFAAALMQIVGVFTFTTSMHERYLFPAVALCLLTYIFLQDKRILLLCAGFSITVYMNTYTIFYGNFGRVTGAGHNMNMMVTSALNITLVIYLGIVLWDLTKGKGSPFDRDSYPL